MGNVNGSLHQAAATGDYNRIRWLNGKADHNQQDDDGWTPLHYAAWHDQPECAANLLAQGSSTSIKDKDGRTPLHLAAIKDRRVVAAILCKAGAEVDSRDGNDMTPLQKAAVCGHANMVEDLIKHGAHVNYQLRDGTTASHLASWKNNSHTLEALIVAGADINVKNEIGQTPLHEAANQGHAKIVEQLLKEGADPRARDNDGNTPASLATDKGHRDIADMLAQASSNPSAFRSGATRRTPAAPASSSAARETKPSAPPMPTAALGAAGMFSPAAIAGLKKEEPKAEPQDAGYSGSNQAVGVWSSPRGEPQAERSAEKPSKQNQPPWITGLQAIQQAAFNMVAGGDGDQGRKPTTSRAKGQPLSAAYADVGGPSQHATRREQAPEMPATKEDDNAEKLRQALKVGPGGVTGMPVPAPTKPQEPAQAASYLSEPPSESRAGAPNQGNPFMGLLGRLGNAMQQIAIEAGGQHQHRDVKADQKSFEKDWAAYGKDQEGGWAMAEGSEDPTKARRPDSSVPIEDQRAKQKIQDLETAIEERERRLNRVGQSVAQGIREDVAKMRAEIQELKGSAAPTGGAPANYMGIAPSPASLDFKIISYNDIYNATDGFNQAYQEGVDGRGITFRAIMYGQPVSVKVLDPAGLASPAAFEREAKGLAKLRHPHLVLLLGACPQGGCLVYEFLSKRNVEELMKGPRDGPGGAPIRLDWRHRVRIAQQMASALLFLHNTRPQPVLHRDVRLGNILLDANTNAKLGEVGLSRLQDDPLSHINRRARDFEQAVRDALPPGTAVFQAPEVLQQARFSPATDVFGLGVAMLQLLAGREPQGLADLVAGAILQRRLAGDVVDPCAGPWPEQHATAFAKMALKCVAYKADERPDLEKDVVPDLTELSLEADTYQGSGQSSAPKGIPAALICPLTQELYEEPVIAADGFTYSRAAITAWLKRNNTSPMTNAPMPHDGLMSNRAIRNAIRDYEGKGYSSSSAPAAPARAPQNQGFSIVG